MEKLRQILHRIDGSGYKAYKDLQGKYCFDRFVLYIDHVQADPFASPSRMRVRVDQKEAQLPAGFVHPPYKAALEDWLARIWRECLSNGEWGRYRLGKGGTITIDAGGQEVLKRTACLITPEYAEARLSISLPAAGRRILSREAEQMLLHDLPQITYQAMFRENRDDKRLHRHVHLYEDQEHIRKQLETLNLVAFVGDGAILPRGAGNSDLPMDQHKAVPFASPPELRVTISTRHHGQVTGMGIPEGITIITGGGYHGKSTLLRAIERGVYNHLGGDGREWVITRNDAVKIRAEDGRAVHSVNISSFIDNLPFGLDTCSFSTDNASGSTSQAANIMEALESGSRLLLLDEDTSAANFMIRDARMQRLIQSEQEPITPFIDRVREMYLRHHISTILVVGGAGDYLDVADRTLMMNVYRAADVTRQAKVIAQEMVSQRLVEANASFHWGPGRIVNSAKLPVARERKMKISAKGRHTILVGQEAVELYGLEQLVDYSQTRALAECLRYVVACGQPTSSLTLLLDDLMEKMSQGMDFLSPYRPGHHPGDLAAPRRHEIAGFINRIRQMRME